ncbi:MAG: hypothetical protein HUJ62_06600, partial [Streptococcus gallolyticus]|nr:hypothetical protein [Streptococcus gallolyticus]
MDKLVLQNIVLPRGEEFSEAGGLFCQVEKSGETGKAHNSGKGAAKVAGLELREECLFIPEGTVLSFNTYMQMLSLAKWKKYTHAQDFCLNVCAKGKFGIEFVNHEFKGFPNDKVEGTYRCYFTDFDKPYKGAAKLVKSKAGKKYKFSSRKQKSEDFKIKDSKATLVGFKIVAKSDVELYSANYSASVRADNLNNVDISLAMTTFNNQQYVLPNIEKLSAEIINSNDEIAEHFNMIVVDNGR